MQVQSHRHPLHRFQSVSLLLLQRAVVFGNKARGIVALPSAKLLHCELGQQLQFKALSRSPTYCQLLTSLEAEGQLILPDLERVFYSLAGSSNIFCEGF